MDKNQIRFVMKGISILILIAGIVFLLFSGYALYQTLNLEAGKSFSFRSAERPNRQAGTFAELASIAAAVYWLIRIVMVKLKNSPFKEWLRQLYMLLQKHHIFLGVITVVIAFIHGLYFFLFRNTNINMGPREHDNTLNFYTGIASFLALDVLAFLGLYHYSQRKTKRNKQSKKQHMIAALVFGILALVHIYLI
ncbi:hypothetical protein HPT25_13095 [Bacillus sp. BRMEA1]|uniref:hypothetical protein n=1 Tax=Neobacillus endophyticus TaxID=2738405 RepID=UPI001563E8A3|nr:hypothetical protein [Neobacillus endophyticus]NRD78302.1 hypothetical protein [Neobacillus endophyticus]